LTFQDSLSAAIFAGVVAIAVTLLIEKYGGAVGGILGTVPTTIVPAAAGIALASNNYSDLNTSLAIVAPGIAEALFATALGLLAAIPAVVAYNKFNSDSKKFSQKLENFSKRFTSII